jgi:hypothetical protein
MSLHELASQLFHLMILLKNRNRDLLHRTYRRILRLPRELHFSGLVIHGVIGHFGFVRFVGAFLAAVTALLANFLDTGFGASPMRTSHLLVALTG